MNSLILITLSLLLFSCNKTDPNPEIRDPIYNDLLASSAAVGQQIEAEKKNMQDNNKQLQETTPQTGQNKTFEKRIRETGELINKLEQEKLYLEIKAESRKKAAKIEYLKAFKLGKPWPDEEAFKIYLVNKKMAASKKTWSVKERIKEMNGDTNKKGPPASPAGH